MLFLKKKIELERELIRKKYIEMYEQIGFIIHTPMELKISYDPSLHFVNCSICHFKKDYFEGSELSNYCVSQPALRTNTYRELQSNHPLTYTAELEMLGAFSKCDNTNVTEELCLHITAQADFIRSILPFNRISVEFSKQIYDFLDEETLKHLSYLNIDIVMRSEPIQWKYGIDDIKGVGTNWNIYSKTQHCEFGNVVLLFRGDCYVGVESGGAIEALLRILNDFPHKIFANTYCTEYIANEMNTNKSYTVEYYDSLNVISNIAWYFRQECPLQMKSILERYVRTVKSYLILHNISEDDFAESVYQISKYHNYWKDNPSELYNIISSYLVKIWNVELLVQNRCNKRTPSFRGFNALEIMALCKLLSPSKEEL